MKLSLIVLAFDLMFDTADEAFKLFVELLDDLPAREIVSPFYFAGAHTETAPKLSFSFDVQVTNIPGPMQASCSTQRIKIRPTGQKSIHVDLCIAQHATCPSLWQGRRCGMHLAAPVWCNLAVWSILILCNVQQDFRTELYTPQ